MGNSSQSLINSLIVTALMIAGGCTKERPYELLPHEQVENKAVIDTAAEYVYVPSTLNTDRTAAAGRPYWQGEQKLVKVRFSEHSLDVVQIDPETRFADNQANQKAVLSIPVEHIQFRCTKNSVGECGNKEERDELTTWSARENFKADFSALTVAEVNTLPIELQNLFGSGKCYPEAGSRFLGYRFEDGAINFQVERTFHASVECASQVSSLDDLTFSVIYHYSLVKLDKIATPGYQAVEYPQADQNRFGFFTTDLHKLSIDERDRKEGEKTFLNRWNPDRDKIVYYLSDEFAKPQYAAVKKATYESFAALNDGLARAGVKPRLELRQGDGKIAGDLRNSMIVMVEDPVAAGLLGYGPSVANPKTGEILSARVVMYMGATKQTVRTTYEELREEQASALAAAAKAAGVGASGAAGALGVPPITGSSVAQSVAATASGRIKAGARTAGAHASAGLPVAGRGGFPADLAKLKAEVLDYKARVTPDSRLASRIEVASKNCVYTDENLDVKDAMLATVREVIGDGVMAPWEDLANADKQRLLDILVPFIWSPILVHEMGHNLGLRHNFQGSEDKDNFYTADELAAMGVKHEVPYSSVMEYSSKSTNELRTLGKYDVAALRFGYLRQDVKKDGTLVAAGAVAQAAAQVAKEELHEFGYCTDEHVDVNAGCKRFDAGSSLVEIAQSQIDSYERRYKFRNRRNNARNFSIFGDGAYAASIEGVFGNLRLMLETVERIQTRFNVTEAQWGEIEFLKDLRAAAQLSGDFFLRVLAMPDALCVVQGADGKAQIIPLSVVSKDASSCGNAEVLETLDRAKFALIGEGGKLFQSRKDPASDNPYADQIDVRGIWIDKLLAAKYLLARELGVTNLDVAKLNYLDFRDLGPRVEKLMSSIALNRIEDQPVKLTLVTGEEIEIPLTYSLDVETAQLIRKHPAGLVQTDTLLSKQLVETAVKLLPDVSHTAASDAFLDAFRVYSSLPNGATPSDYRQVRVGSRVFLALEANRLARDVMSRLDAVRVLGKLAEAKLTVLLGELKAGTPERAEATAEEKAARAQGATLIEAFLNGELESESYYATLLTDVLAN